MATTKREALAKKTRALIGTGDVDVKSVINKAIEQNFLFAALFTIKSDFPHLIDAAKDACKKLKFEFQQARQRDYCLAVFDETVDTSGWSAI